MNPIGYVAVEYSSGGSPMEVVDGVIRESAEDIREVAYGLNRIPGEKRYEAAVIVHIDDLERLTAERDELRQQIDDAEDRRAGAVLRERQALAERDEALAEVKRLTERLDATRRLHDRATETNINVRQQLGDALAERDSLKGLLSGSQQELRDAIVAQGKTEAERDGASMAARELRAERDTARAELEKKRTMLGQALSVPILGDARAEIGGLRAELEMHKRGAKEARRQDDERHAVVARERDEARAAIDRVRALHPSEEGANGKLYCVTCRGPEGSRNVLAPCPTVTATDGSGT